MNTSVILEKFMIYMNNPQLENYLNVRQEIVNSNKYDPYSKVFDNAHALSTAGKFQESLSLLMENCEDIILCPSAHKMLAFLHHKLGDETGSGVEKELAMLCLMGIEMTGNGEVNSPYLVTRIYDEKDMLWYFRKEFKMQAFMTVNEKHLDAVHCKDGSIIHFDITDAYNKLNGNLTSR